VTEAVGACFGTALAAAAMMFRKCVVSLVFTPVLAMAAVNYTRILNTASTEFHVTTSITAMTADEAGNVYLTGTTNSPNFPTTAGSLQTALAPGTCTFIFDPHSPPIPYQCPDAFVVKIDAGGNVVFSTLLGGNGQDAGWAIAVDAQGAIYVAGTTSRAPEINSFPTTAGAAYRSGSLQARDAFVTKLNALGSAILYSTFLPGLGHSTPLAMAVDAAGNVFFAGDALPSEGLFTPSQGAYQTTAERDHFHVALLKLNAAGSAVVFGTYVAGSSWDYAGGLALDATGNLYLAGSTYSTDFPITAGAFQTTRRSLVSSGFVAKLNPAGGAVVYSTLIGGSSNDGASTIRVDSQGNAIVFGTTTSSDFPATSGAFESAPKAGVWSTASPYSSTRAFVLSLNPQGAALNYATYFDGAAALDADGAGNVYVSGGAGYGLPTTSGAAQRCGAGAFDAFVAQLDSHGKLAAASYVGGSLADSAAAIAVAPNGMVIAAGSTLSSDFPAVKQPLSAAQTFVTQLRIADPSQRDAPCIALVAQNGASFLEGPIAPGEWVTLRGLGFGPDQGVARDLSLAPPIGAQLGGVQVFFDGIAAPLLYVQSQQINVQVPWEVAGKASTQIHVEYAGQSSNTATVPVVAASPGLFVIGATNQAAAINQDGTVNSASNPAKRGTVVSVYGTGGGATNPPGVTGGDAPLSPLEFLSLPVTAELGPNAADVPFAGAAPTLVSGVFQINIVIPQNLPTGLSEWPVTVKVGGAMSPGVTTYIAVGAQM
jgi:uncharacterized protein (TIGR03437 family)